MKGFIRVEKEKWFNLRDSKSNAISGRSIRRGSGTERPSIQGMREIRRQDIFIHGSSDSGMECDS